MTHEPIHTVHLTPYITWQGTQAELEAMKKEGWPMGSASEIIAACKRDAAEAEAYAAKLEAKLAKAVEKFAALEKAASDVARRGAKTGPQWTKLTIALLAASATLAELKGESHE
jgi:hypothetical protein